MEKIKRFSQDWIEGDGGKDILIISIVILVGISSFILGRLSKEDSKSGIKIEYAQESANAISAITSTENNNNNVVPIIKKSGATSGNFFASSKGKNYYPLGCSAGKSLKLENRVYFNSSAEAEKAGYKLSGSCN